MVDLSMYLDSNTSSKIAKNDSVPSFHGDDTLTEVITMPTKGSMTDVSLTSSEWKHKALESKKIRDLMDRRPAYANELSMADMSRRLNIRRQLHDQLYDKYFISSIEIFFLLGLL
jgi:hypothetical protein